MHELISKKLDKIVSIIKTINPHRIYLFGSFSSGSADEHSDLDLLVVAPSDKTPLERRLTLRRMLKDYDREIGLDMLVYTPEEFEMLANMPSSFLHSTLKKAKKLYEHQAA